MAVFDGLVNWWGWGDAAVALFDPGTFETPEIVTFADHIAAYGLPPHNGEYGTGLVTYAPGEAVNGHANAFTPASWSCRADESGIQQRIPTSDELNPVIDPQVGHFASNMGTVPYPGGGLWFDPREGWTFAIFAATLKGYYISRQSIVPRQYLVGDHLTTSFLDKGWNIVCDFGTAPNPAWAFYLNDVAAHPSEYSFGNPLTPRATAIFNACHTNDGLHDPVPTIYDDTAAHKFVMNNGLSKFALGFGTASLDYELLVVTYDSVTLRTYNLAENYNAPVEERPTTTGEFVMGGEAYAWGARYNRGSDDNGYNAPWNGAWDETLQWSRPLSLDEIKQFAHACDSNAKAHRRFRAVNSDSHNRYARPRTIRGATGQSIPFDPAGHDTENTEPVGANVHLLNQTAWYVWTSPSTRTVTFHTAAGHPADLYSAAPLVLLTPAVRDKTKLFNTLSVWQGVSLGGLTEIGSSGNSSIDGGVTFGAVEGETYHIQVGTGPPGANGSAVLTWE